MMDFLCEISYTRVRPTCCILLYDPQLVVETQSRGGVSGYNLVTMLLITGKLVMNIHFVVLYNNLSRNNFFFIYKREGKNKICT